MRPCFRASRPRSVPRLLAALACAGLAVSAAAQGPLFPSDQVIGWSDLPSPTTTGFIDVQDIDNNCQPAQSICKTAGPVRAPVPYAGGTAYDARYQSVWVSEGVVLVEYDVRTCQVRCKQTPSLLNPQAYVSGLAIADRKPRLFQLATLPGYWEVVTYDNTKCPPVAIGRCSSTSGPRDLAAGLAYDEATDRLFISLSSALATGGFQTTVLVAPAGSPCNPTCKFQVMTNCSSQVVTGLGFDACSRRLYVTDGQVSQVLVVDVPNCQAKPVVTCCKKQITPVWRGLAVVPGWRKGVTGRPCFGRPCAACPAMSLDTAGGDPVLGNAQFGFQLSNAPAGSIGVFVLGAGPCTPGVPFGCGLLFPSLAPPPIILPPALLPGLAPCGGQGGFPLPIPVFPGLCQQIFCGQAVVFCPSGGLFGIGLSNGLQFTIVGG